MPMSTVFERIQTAVDAGEHLDWCQLREEIHDAHEKATTSAERERLLAAFSALMDRVERIDIAPENLAVFRETRLEDYHLLVVRECVVGETVCTETLDAVTLREVAAGRMAPDDELRVTAVDGMADSHYSRPELEAMAAAKPGSPLAKQSTRRRGLFGRLTGR